MSGSAELVEDSESLFKKVNAGLKPILGDDSSLYDNDGVYATISLIEQCAERVEKEHLMSKNEQLEDILTSTMKFLFLHYYMGKCYQSLHGMEDRLVNTLAAKDSYTAYLKECARLDLTHSADKEGHETHGSMTADARRMYKIEKYKRDKSAKARINELQRQLYIAKKDEDGGGDQEAALRELYLTQLQCYARESMDELDMIQQEMVMLKFQAQQQQQQRQAGGGDEQQGDARTRPGGGDRHSSGRDPSGHGAGFPPHQPPPGPGISVTRTFKVGDQIMFSRETVKATVFGSHIAPPTMTLEEFGDLEKADALAREAQKPEDGAAHANRRYKQLEADGDEDDDELVEKAADKDRAWDDWKDNNPKGWGNKMGKRF